DHQKVIYRCWKTVDKETIDFEILDTANKSSIKWADGFQIMYSITDRSSSESTLGEMTTLNVWKHQERAIKLSIPTVIVVNKCDMENGGADRRRKGPSSCMFRCSFFELSAAECSVAVEVAVERLVREVRLEYQRHLLAMDSHSSSLAAMVMKAFHRKYTHTHTHTHTVCLWHIWLMHNCIKVHTALIWHLTTSMGV
uniref:small monomeric GTPase n=1 Tax=Oncorhynchus mykiss TaxID=8022 RepID=A0A8C7WFZ8_ONCMY